jgi:hypothetical protein
MAQSVWYKLWFGLMAYAPIQRHHVVRAISHMRYAISSHLSIRVTSDGSDAVHRNPMR